MYGLTVDRTSGLSVAKQLYRQIRKKILEGQLQAGARLPATRNLASQLNVARNTVVEVYEQLKVEGFFISHQGSYTTVAPNTCLTQLPPVPPAVGRNQEKVTANLIDFRYGIPALDLFPRTAWQKSVAQVIADIPAAYFGYNHPDGCLELRSALTNYLFTTRGIVTSPEQIMVTSGSTQAFYLITRLLCSHNRKVIIADPVNHDVQRYLTILGCDLASVPIDGQGLQTSLLPAQKDFSPSFTLVTPSQQFPTGGILSIQRRIQLINFARNTNSYLVEDDYENEFTYEKGPVPALQELDPEKVIYVGSFSKVLIPALRLGYLILPRNLLDIFYRSDWFATQQPSAIDQLSLAMFINTGQLQRHVARMNKVYHKRRNKLTLALAHHFADSAEILNRPLGLHLTVRFKDVTFSSPVLKNILHHGVRIYPVEQHVIHRTDKKFSDQAILGFGNVTETEIAEGVRRLKAALKQAPPQ